MKNASSRLRFHYRAARVAAALLVMVLPVAACSEAPRALADYLTAICVTPFRSSSPEESLFLAENANAMSKMMVDMGIRPTGRVDGDFAALMIAHHQGAIEMALLELRYGRDEQLRRLAQEIIVTQQQEIAVMRLALGDVPQAPRPSAFAEASDVQNRQAGRDQAGSAP